MLDNFPRKPLLLLRRAFRGRLHPDLRPATAAASVQCGSAETSAAPSRAPVSFQKASAPSWHRLCSKRQPDPRQVSGPDTTRAAQRFLALEGLRPYIILGASPGDGLTAGLPRGFPSEQVASVEESPGGRGMKPKSCGGVLFPRGATWQWQVLVVTWGIGATLVPQKSSLLAAVIYDLSLPGLVS